MLHEQRFGEVNPYTLLPRPILLENGEQFKPFPQTIPFEHLLNIGVGNLKEHGLTCTESEYLTILGVSKKEVKELAQADAVIIGSRARMLCFEKTENVLGFKFGSDITDLVSPACTTNPNVQGCSDLDVLILYDPNAQSDFKGFIPSRTYPGGYRRILKSKSGVDIEYLYFPKSVINLHPAIEWAALRAVTKQDTISTIPQSDGSVITVDPFGALQSDPSFASIDYYTERKKLLSEYPNRALTQLVNLMSAAVSLDIESQLHDYRDFIETLNLSTLPKPAIDSLRSQIERCIRIFCKTNDARDFFLSRLKRLGIEQYGINLESVVGFA